VHALVLALAKAGKLDTAKESARGRMRERVEKRRKDATAGGGSGMEED